MGAHCSKGEKQSPKDSLSSSKSTNSNGKTHDSSYMQKTRIKINITQSNLNSDSKNEIKSSEACSKEIIPKSILKKQISLGSDEDIRDFYEFDPTAIGNGHFGTVRKASSILFPNKTFAVKSIPLSKLQNDRDVSFISTELDILRQVHHPNILRFFETYQDHKYIHIITEFLSGGDLLDHMIGSPNQCIKENEAAKIIKEVLLAVNFLHHNGFAHRDLKPENILFTTPEKKHVKIIDFGLSKRFGESNISSLNSMVGTRFYIAPEVLERKPYNYLCDNWSIGTIMYFMLCGRPPFFENNKSELFDQILKGELLFKEDIWKNISSEAKDLIQKLIVKNPSDRISVEDALHHDWIKHNGGIKLVTSEMEKLMEIREKIYKSFKNLLNNTHYSITNYSSKLKVIFFHLFLNVLEDDVLEDLHIIFKFFDNGKGSITYDDLLFGLKELSFKEEFNEEEIKSLIKVINLQNPYENKDEDTLKINYNTFLLALLVSQPDYDHFENDNFFKLFSYLDPLKCGFISNEDLKLICKRKAVEITENEINEILSKNKMKSEGKLEFKYLRQMYKYAHSSNELNFSWSEQDCKIMEENEKISRDLDQIENNTRY